MNRLSLLVAVLFLVALAALALVALAGCGGQTTETTTTGGGTGATEPVVYTVNIDDLENPENKPVYVCPMEEHKEQVSLDPDARCAICSMKLVPMEEAEKAWGGESGEAAATE